ncbi:MAG: hypothetical protein K5656_06085 [Lachnospiraceae bacterium]|nr:hypothetical protein [Lachnospiraceae bacterium]
MMTIFTILMIFLLFKLSFFLLSVCGKVMALLFTVVGYCILAILAVGLFGIAVAIIPILLLIGLFTLLGIAFA